MNTNQKSTFHAVTNFPGTLEAVMLMKVGTNKSEDKKSIENASGFE